MESIIQQTFDILVLLFTHMLPVLFIVTFLQEKGLLNRLDSLSRWIIKWTGFSTITEQAFIANLGSVYAGPRNGLVHFNNLFNREYVMCITSIRWLQVHLQIKYGFLKESL